MRNSQEIIKEINALLQELSAAPSKRGRSKQESSNKASKSQENYSGPSGGLRLLIKEGFFKAPKMLSEVTNRLHQDGFRYPTKTISVCLLRLVRSRVLVRLPAKNRKKNEMWVYSERK